MRLKDDVGNSESSSANNAYTQGMQQGQQLADLILSIVDLRFNSILKRLEDMEKKLPTPREG